MPHEMPLFDDLLKLLAVSVPIVFVFTRLRLPVVAGFMMTGILIGPYGLGLIREVEAVEALAEIGVVLLLFTIGLEFSIRRIIDMKRLVVGGGGLQVLLTGAAALGLAHLLGRPMNQCIFIGFLVALSSTAIVLKSYMDRAEVDAPHGRAGVGILLFQDLCIVPMMLVIPILSGQEGLSGLKVATTLGTAAIAIVAIVVTARTLVPFLLHHVVRLRSQEVFVIFVVLIVLGTSWLTAAIGMSLAIGAFIAGLVLSESEYSHQIVADILPFRDVFNSIFFVSIGMLLSLEALAANALVVVGLVVALVVVKAALAVVAVRVLGFSLRISVVAGLGVAQIGEFSFILAKGGLGQGLLLAEDYQTFLGVSIISMMATPFLIALAPRIGYAVQSLLSPGSMLEPSIGDFSVFGEKRDHVVIIGYGLNGKNLSLVLKRVRIPYNVVELNGEAVREARAEGEPIAYGDATRREVLDAAGAEHARALVVAISDPTASRRIVQLARRVNPKLQIVVRTRYMSELEDLYELGADQVIPEEFETSLEIFARVLEEYGISRMKILQQKESLRGDGYRVLRAPTGETMDISNLAEVLEATSTQTLRVEEGSPAANARIGDLDLRKRTGATVIAVSRNGLTEVNPGPDFRLMPDDTIILLGSTRQLDHALGIFMGSTDGHRDAAAHAAHDAKGGGKEDA